MSDIVDRIDALVDEQMVGGEPRTGYDYNDPTYPKCGHCNRDFHGLPITERIEEMRRRRTFDNDYRVDTDTTRVLCQGSGFIGPMPAETPSATMPQRVACNALSQMHNAAMSSAMGMPPHAVGCPVCIDCGAEIEPLRTCQVAVSGGMRHPLCPNCYYEHQRPTRITTRELPANRETVIPVLGPIRWATSTTERDQFIRLIRVETRLTPAQTAGRSVVGVTYRHPDDPEALYAAFEIDNQYLEMMPDGVEIHRVDVGHDTRVAFVAKQGGVAFNLIREERT